MATLATLRHAVRKDADDLVPPYLAAEEDVDRALNNAVLEACIRTRSLQDETSRLCRIALIAGQARYRLNPAILTVRSALVPNRGRALHRTTTHDLDRKHPGWSHEPERHQPATPRYIAFDVGTKQAVLYPTPNLDGIMYLRVWRTPLDTEVMESEQDEPVIVLPDPEALRHWALFELYSQKDSELEDEPRAQKHLALFDALMGPRPDAAAIQSWSIDKAPDRRMQSEF